MADESLSASARRVQAALDGLGLSLQVVELPASTRTAAEAAAAVGAQVGQIVKSLLLRGQSSGLPYLILTSGSNRLDLQRASALAGEPVALAKPEFVREQTGFSIGGVPPLGHLQPIRTWIDRDLMAHDVIWAAAGTPNAVFRLTGEQLLRMTAGELADVSLTT
jgi:prolyl-tRNA editing enzyme YbaK/EbsC (Cys-tRNA(Pro) deacylase)